MPKPAAKVPLEAVSANDLYETDFYAWTQEQARLLRDGRWADLDLDNLIEEVECVGRSERQQVESRLRVLIAHLLKWKYQPGARSNSWRSTIEEQRYRIANILEASPSLSDHPAAVFEACYRGGRLRASDETGIDFTLFPESPPFTVEQVLSEGFLPKEPDLLDLS